MCAISRRADQRLQGVGSTIRNLGWSARGRWRIEPRRSHVGGMSPSLDTREPHVVHYRVGLLRVKRILSEYRSASAVLTAGGGSPRWTPTTPAAGHPRPMAVSSARAADGAASEEAALTWRDGLMHNRSVPDRPSEERHRPASLGRCLANAGEARPLRPPPRAHRQMVRPLRDIPAQNRSTMVSAKPRGGCSLNLRR